MISVGIDVAKGKSTICAIKPSGEVLLKPRDYKHNTTELDSLVKKISSFTEEIHVTMEATGDYHLPVLKFLKDKGFFVSVINPLEMKRYRCQGIRNPKTDRIDSLIIAQYGIDFWYKASQYAEIDSARKELQTLGRKYREVMKTRVSQCQELDHLLELTMPGVYGLLPDFNKESGSDKLADFAYDWWHYDNIKKSSEKMFVKKYGNWLKKKGYRQNEEEAQQLYSLAVTSIPVLPSDNASTKMLVQSSVKILREVDASLCSILSQMRALAKARYIQTSKKEQVCGYAVPAPFKIHSNDFKSSILRSL